MSKGGKALIKAGLPVFLRAQDDRVSISGYTKSEAAKALGTNGSDRLNIRADDFVAVTTALATVDLIGEVGILFDAGMVAFTFETEFAQYAVHVPAALDKLVRSDRHLIALSPTPWPIVEDITSAAADAPTENGGDLDAPSS